MSRGTWDRPIGDLRAVQPEEKRVPGRKDTRRWCRGKAGRQHTPEIVIPENTDTIAGRRGCAPGPAWSQNGWWCLHVERCTACGKILRAVWQLKPEECPVWRAQHPDEVPR